MQGEHNNLSSKQASVLLSAVFTVTTCGAAQRLLCVQFSTYESAHSQMMTHGQIDQWRPSQDQKVLSYKLKEIG